VHGHSTDTGVLPPLNDTKPARFIRLTGPTVQQRLRIFLFQHSAARIPAYKPNVRLLLASSWRLFSGLVHRDTSCFFNMFTYMQ
jgi:hypothetical protein